MWWINNLSGLSYNDGTISDDVILSTMTKNSAGVTIVGTDKSYIFYETVGTIAPSTTLLGFINPFERI